jgi:HK97 family phage prohead protease
VLRKSFTAEIKSARGEVEAVIATMGVKDLDGDVITRGAFGRQDVVISAYQHGSWKGALPIGKGTVSERGDEAILSGRLLMDTSHGRDAFATIKELGPLMEWSFGFDVLDSEQGTHAGEPVRVLKALTVHEASPVLKGAGIATRTLSAKGSSASTISPEDLRIAQWRVVRADPELQRQAKARVQIRMAAEERLAAERIGRAMLLLAKRGR